MARHGPELDAKEKLFVETYIQTRDARGSALHAGYSLTVARSTAYLWVSSPFEKKRVYEAVQDGLEKLVRKSRISNAQIEERLERIAFANPRDLIDLQRGCCRHCYGENGGYQWTEAEYYAAVEGAEKARGKMPAWGGGIDFDPFKDPNPECKNCVGVGVERVVPKDTRDYSPDAAALYAGVKITKQGLEIKTHNQLEALQLLAKMRGVLVDKKELSGPGGAALIPSRIELIAVDEAEDEE